MTTAEQPFQFATAAYLTRVENQRVHNIAEMDAALAEASDASIFYHTFQTLSRHHFLTEGFSNDFAQWVLAGLNQPALAERLASIDVRDYISLAELRADLRRIIASFREENPGADERQAFEPFYFLQAVEVTELLPWDAKTLAGFRANLERLSHASFYYHFIASRLRLQLRTNDFSHWFENQLGLKELADRANRIDIYTNTLDTARQELSQLVEHEIAK
jgi:hypothetical protein